MTRGHRYAGVDFARRFERHFGGAAKTTPPPPPPPPAATDPVPQKAVADARAAAKKRRGLAASILSGTSGELAPAGERKEYLG